MIFFIYLQGFEGKKIGGLFDLIKIMFFGLSLDFFEYYSHNACRLLS